jgi:hypothetical protein
MRYLKCLIASLLLLITGCTGYQNSLVQNKAYTRGITAWDVDLYYKYTKKNSVVSDPKGTDDKNAQGGLPLKDAYFGDAYDYAAWDVDLNYKYTKKNSVVSDPKGTDNKNAQGGQPLKDAYFWDAYDHATNDEEKKAVRNKIMNELIMLIDDAYYEQVDRLRHNLAMMHIFGDAISQVLSTTGAIVTGHATSILAAVDSGWKGSMSSFDRNELRNTLVEVLINTSIANRDHTLAQIYKSMYCLPDKDYSLQAGVRDIANYHRQGSITIALASLSGTAASKSKESAQVLDSLRGSLISQPNGSVPIGGEKPKPQKPADGKK